ncbi:MAG: hypothetical protein N3I86_03160 [Verrucomicrobiae bacterium]|nr:hypothetical protein [Verrucomicrobiae bacterium]
MKVGWILREIETVKERLDAQAGGDLHRFLLQMDAWEAEHPHSGAVVNSPEELHARVRRREATEPTPPCPEPYRVFDPIVAEVHRIREQLQREDQNVPMALKDEPTSGTDAT